MSQDFRKTILIVCEGQRSEPDYFHNLRNEVLEKNNNVFITILPIPKAEQAEIDKDVKEFQLRRGAKKRELKSAINEEPADYIIENEFKAQPTCYIRKAQLAYSEMGFSELWAIYDKDGHSDHNNAYLLSIDKSRCDKTVNIGFSSISFEEWILMHFEYCKKEFTKSQCRDRNKRAYNCGTNNNELDCHGQSCVVGHIVESGYLTYNKSKNFNYDKYSMNVNIAFQNALMSRNDANDREIFYNNNPYVSIDRLVYKLKFIDKGDLVWIYNNVIVLSRDIIIRIENSGGNTSFVLLNQSSSNFILQDNCVQLVDFEFNIHYANERKLIEPQSSFNICEFNNLSLETFQYAIFKISEIEYQILDIVQIKNFT